MNPFSFPEDQQLSATTQGVYTILEDHGSDEEEALSTKASDETPADSSMSSTTPDNFSDDDGDESDDEDEKDRSFHSADLKALALALAQLQQELPIVEIRVCPSTPNVYDSRVEVIDVQESECVEHERRKGKYFANVNFN